MNEGFKKTNPKSEPIVAPVADPQLLMTRLATWFPDLQKASIEKLGVTFAQVLRFNSTLGLIPTTSLLNADALFYADSIYASRLVIKNMVKSEPLFDLGSGAGFPGLIFGALYPDLKVTLVDRDARKIEFLKHVISEAKLSNVTVLHSAIEDLKDRSIKNAIARDLGPLPRTMLLVRKAVSAGGKLYHMKSDGWANELGAVPTQLFSFWSPSLLGQYSIPDANMEMAVVLTDKVAD